MHAKNKHTLKIFLKLLTSTLIGFTLFILIPDFAYNYIQHDALFALAGLFIIVVFAGWVMATVAWVVDD